MKLTIYTVEGACHILYHLVSRVCVPYISCALHKSHFVQRNVGPWEAPRSGLISSSGWSKWTSRLCKCRHQHPTWATPLDYTGSWAHIKTWRKSMVGVERRSINWMEDFTQKYEKLRQFLLDLFESPIDFQRFCTVWEAMLFSWMWQRWLMTGEVKAQAHGIKCHSLTDPASYLRMNSKRRRFLLV